MFGLCGKIKNRTTQDNPLTRASRVGEGTTKKHPFIYT